MTGAPAPIRVLVADDQHLIRRGLCAIIDAESDLRVVAEASDGSSAAHQAAAHRADVVLMDVQMPGRRRHRGRSVSSASRVPKHVCSC